MRTVRRIHCIAFRGKEKSAAREAIAHWLSAVEHASGGRTPQPVKHGRSSLTTVSRRSATWSPWITTSDPHFAHVRGGSRGVSPLRPFRGAIVLFRSSCHLARARDSLCKSDCEHAPTDEGEATRRAGGPSLSGHVGGLSSRSSGEIWAVRNCAPNASGGGRLCR